MPTSLHFDTAFWSHRQNGASSPEFSSGLQGLHQKLYQSEVENEELITFFKERIAVETLYSNRLTDQSKTACKPNGFGRNDGGGLKTCFDKIKKASEEWGQQHRETSVFLTDYCVKPMQKIQDDFKQATSQHRKMIEGTLREYDGLVKEADKARQVYHRRCRDADAAEELALKQTDQRGGSVRPSLDEGPTDPQGPTPPSAAADEVQFGRQTISLADLDGLVRSMRSGIPAREHRVPILGRYANTSTGEEIASWLQTHLPQCKDSPAMSDTIGQQLINPLGVLRLVGQRGSKFVASPQAIYQWRTNVDDDAQSNVTSTSSIGGFLERIGTMRTSTSVTRTDPHKKARRDAELADEAYRNAVKRADHMRMTVETSLFTYFQEMETLEHRRLDAIKQVLEEFSNHFSETLAPRDKDIADTMVLGIKPWLPKDDIGTMVEQNFVSSFYPKVILYDNYYHGIGLDQVFGVPLDDLSKHTSTGVPGIVTSLIEAIEHGAESLEPTERKYIWTTATPLERVHRLRSNVNVPSDRITPQLFASYEPQLLARLLWLYLLELPECLLTYEFTDAAQVLYTNDHADAAVRIPSLSNLVATLPSAHFVTLRALLDHFSRWIKGVEASPETIREVSLSMGPTLARARDESYDSHVSIMPSAVFMDLVEYYDKVFSESTLQSHADNEKRRLAQPLVAQVATEPVPTQPPRLLSFMRRNTPKVDTSVSNQQDSKSPSSFNAIISPSAITQSPPPSPVKEVMFSMDDEMAAKEPPAETPLGTKDHTPLDASHSPPHDEPPLDPFFADD